MRLEWDEAKRARVLAERGLDFADATEVFEGLHFDLAGDGEIPGGAATFGFLHDRLVALIWTPRSGGRRIHSMRYAHEGEPRRFEDAFRRMDRSR